jgi:protoporphyrinogen oxidase
VQAAGNSLVYTSLICVTIGISGTVPDFSWLYIPEPSLGRTNRISFPSNYSSRTAPAGCSSVLAEITHQPRDEVSRLTDSELIGQVTETLEKMEIIKKSQVIWSRVYHRPFAYVVYDLDYQKNIRVIREFCASIGIPLVGRFARFEYLNMDGCIRSVMDFAAHRAQGQDPPVTVRHHH